MDDEQKPRGYEVRVRLPDLDGVANKIEGWSDNVRKFENNPPRWFLLLLALLPVAFAAFLRSLHH